MSPIHFSARLTPAVVAQTKEIYSIPIYQRLFEWDEPQIVQLLDDLYQGFLQAPSQPYYIGMLTSNRHNDLIDGQQRFTVMMLLGIVLSRYDADWNRFLFPEPNVVRLKFAARMLDSQYLRNRCCPVDGYENWYMKRGVQCIQRFVDQLTGQERAAYARYAFENLSFFVSRLPNDYSPKALNQYFETMNSTGKNLENHEVLKVKLLHAARRFDKMQLTQIWNAVGDMDRKLIRRKGKDEKRSDLQWRFQQAYEAIERQDLDGLFCGQSLNVLTDDAIDEDPLASLNVGDIPASHEKPVQQRLSRNNGFHSMLSFSEFLLQVLWLQLDQATRKKVGVKHFFDVNRLQETFRTYWMQIDADEFILALLKYRLLYDRYVITISNEEATYDLEVDTYGVDAEGNSYHDLLLMYESMLYVNSSAASYYLWLPSLLSLAAARNGEITGEELYDHLKQEDEQHHPLPANLSDLGTLSYRVVDRYWFWKLDFHIWRSRKRLFQDESVRCVADNYMFRRNRSIEHIAPQTPDADSTLRLPDDVENCFGNLVMISSAQNSSLLNSTFEVKRAKVVSYVHKELTGTIESLKMLMIYQYQHWDEVCIQDHHQACVALLEQSFG